MRPHLSPASWPRRGAETCFASQRARPLIVAATSNDRLSSFMSSPLVRIVRQIWATGWLGCLAAGGSEGPVRAPAAIGRPGWLRPRPRGRGRTMVFRVRPAPSSKSVVDRTDRIPTTPPPRGRPPTPGSGERACRPGYEPSPVRLAEYPAERSSPPRRKGLFLAALADAHAAGQLVFFCEIEGLRRRQACVAAGLRRASRAAQAQDLVRLHQSGSGSPLGRRRPLSLN